MFSALKQYIKYRIMCILYDVMKTRYEAQNWSITTNCPSCTQLIPITAHFCAYCGQEVQLAITNQKTVQLQITGPLQIKQVVTMLPPDAAHGRFLRYARTQKNQIGPATLAHRQLQDLEGPRIPHHNY
ncbi:hypothetical protein KDW_16210 [Dictyobacter vulcani]|uniref:Zinc-ribbon domain-containing protein n=1 Tax=Dictyobacter vulcani TaxID=2607529 RepID=A0A5J4KMV8_9CHLR|nr:hypothetical protein [Dictyobacter vulcani]GER87459.1 hypothetical protein KDW_16210 [Dictyobacter vulcani]